MHRANAVKIQAMCHTFVFSDVVMAAPFLDNFKMLNITFYDEKCDPVAHMEVFRSWIDFKRVLKLARYRTFSLILLGLA